MSKHEKQDDDEWIKKNGYRPGPLQPEGPGGKHEKKDEDDKGTGDEDKK
jgi:hypothetical protein